jgi:Tfp pilus assembly protein PilE
MSRPQAGEYNSFFERYINQTKAQNAHALLEELTAVLENFYTGLPESKADYAYAQDFEGSITTCDRCGENL